MTNNESRSPEDVIIYVIYFYFLRSNEITFSVFNDSWLTFNTHYNSDITCDNFRHAVQNGEYIKYNIKDLINVENLNIINYKLNLLEMHIH